MIARSRTLSFCSSQQSPSREISFCVHRKKLTKSYIKHSKEYLPVAFGEELRLFGSRSMWTTLGPTTIENNIFIFEASSQSRNEDEFHFSLGWQQFRKSYGLRTKDTLFFRI
ncbi:hypothetical protein PIB30_019145 [Stylosanthes scabra]|nr:hypothetical protein [Stylosanthes scabra]